MKTAIQINEEFSRSCWQELDLPLTPSDDQTLAERFTEHAAHSNRIVVARYGETLANGEFEAVNIAVECLRCNEVLLDSDVLENAPSNDEDE